MYTSYFGLEEKPFSIAPNPDYLFMSDRHREALNHLTYGLGDTGGFVLLTGEVGTGKTTISRRLMANLPENTQAAFILNPTLSSQELLATLCDELKIRYRKTGATLKTLTDKIQQKLLKNHESNINTLLIIDEAQHLQPEVLEQLRLLTNLETNTKKLLQVILIGQPELQQLLQRRDLRQLAQRITARYHLLPLNKQEVEQYLKHRLSVAKCFRNIFDKSAIKAIHKTCNGIPRLMNLLAERSLMNAYNSNNAVVNGKIVRQAARDALSDEFHTQAWWQSAWLKVGAGVTLLALFLAMGMWWGAQLINGNRLSTPPLTSHQQSAPATTASVPLTSAAQVEKSQSKLTNSGSDDTSAQPITANTELQVNHEPGQSAALENIATENNSSTDRSSSRLEVTENNTATPAPTNTDTKPTTNFVLEASEGVSDELLASFQSAIAETTAIENSPTTTATPPSDLAPLSQMPTWIQDSVPALAFEMHIYASDGQGWVRVNGRDRYEGDYIARELLLHEIQPQQVVLSFRGEKFTMAALSSWQ
ncbi:Type II secretory pathway, component ExeA (predicted ATPase) [Colwellia chukchiensis]|uniref:Type II secretory pathway, component ExeA (Predicted ATPase) n=1 Tax=Colwellia chukchiensis TaxID=641665 RepID=A0A1H7J2U2_9GAMM|nr:AAA family ATPase [Colwellia chukchiensis]SEK69039.1 Type II secretory pathway, component ExeA (predicted ATPase) [Colwellia chukchiensis]